MKNVIKILSVLLLSLTINQSFAQSDDLVNVCALGIGNATYLKDFKVKLPANSTTPTKFSVILNKGNMYKFVVCNAEGYEGKAVIQLSEANNVLVSNLKPDGTFAEAVGFSCAKTGMYNIMCSFKNAKEGAAVIIMSYITK